MYRENLFQKWLSKIEFLEARVGAQKEGIGVLEDLKEKDFSSVKTLDVFLKTNSCDSLM
jgi:hypothetical protein